MSIEELKAIRTDMKLSQSQFAGLLGFRTNSYALMERGLRPIMKTTELAIRSLRADSCWSMPLREDATKHYPQREGKYLHRMVYTQIHGEIPEGLVIDHTCGNIRCINPSHLEAVTQKVNMQRAAIRYRTNKQSSPSQWDGLDFVTLLQYECTRCGYQWVQSPRAMAAPQNCANKKCKSPNWNRPKRKKGTRI